MTTTAERIADHVHAAVLADVVRGAVPRPSRFEDLHDHVDANEYLDQAAAALRHDAAADGYATLNAAVRVLDARFAARAA